MLLLCLADSMLRNGWVPTKKGDGGGGKHSKFRRLLSDGTRQTITMPCSPSDSLRGILNLQVRACSAEGMLHV